MVTSWKTDWRLGLDRVRFARAAHLDPDPWQQQVLRSNAPRILLNCSRQSGKSTIAAVLACHQALYVPGSLTLLHSPTQRQSAELFRRVLALYESLERPVAAEAESVLRLELSNGSRVISLPGKEGTIRGYSGVSLLVIDESARVEDSLYLSVRPMLAVSGGRLLALSTPFGTRGWWYEAWRGSEPWERYRVPATDCPRISPAFLEEERRTIGDWWYQQEYGVEFMDAESAAFRSADIQRIFMKGVETWPL